MNAIALFLALVLQGNPTCAAHPAADTIIDGQPVKVETFDCYWRGSNLPSHNFIVLSPVCPTYTGQPILLSEQNVHQGWVLNEFGEFYPATTNIDMMPVYRPHC